MRRSPSALVKSLGVGAALWAVVALVSWGALRAFASRTPTPAIVVAGPSSCRASLYPVDGEPDPVAAILAAPSACGGAASADPKALLHAYLDGAELAMTPTAPRPAADAALLARGASLYKEHCARCHGAAGNADGPDTCALTTPPANLAKGVYKIRTTEHEALPTDDDLFATISHGVHGTAMPPWFVLPERDRWALVEELKAISKAFADDSAPPPVAMTSEPEATPARLAQGRKVFVDGGCASCHGDQGRGDGAGAGALAVKPRNFPRGHMHRGSTVAAIHTTVVTGFDGTPMGSFAKVLGDEDMWDVALYVHTLVPSTQERGGLRCPTTTPSVDFQELLAVRAAARALASSR